MHLILPKRVNSYFWNNYYCCPLFIKYVVVFHVIWLGIYIDHISHFHTFHSQPTQTLLCPVLSATSTIFILINNLHLLQLKMDTQQQQVYEYSQQMDVVEQHVKAPQHDSTQTDITSITTYKEPHALDCPPHINLATPFEKLEVLCELLVDFDNLKRNNVDLTEELEKQGWGNYFKRLYGHVYTFLVKELWRFSYCNDHCIVS